MFVPILYASSIATPLKTSICVSDYSKAISPSGLC